VSDDGATAYVDRLAVRRDQRNRGLAQALLVDCFALARDHGTTRSELSTDSRTGALGLYERVGMVPTSVWVNRGIDLSQTAESAV
jgi:GNAT superfamily N-acetyltransferase